MDAIIYFIQNSVMNDETISKQKSLKFPKDTVPFALALTFGKHKYLALI